MRAAPLRFVLLASAQFAAGLVSLPFALAGGAYVRSQSVQAAIVVAWWLLSALTLLVAPRWPRWGFATSVFLASLLVALSALIASRGQIQVLEGFGLLVLGVVAAYQLSPRALRAFLVVGSALYVTALILNPLLLAWWLAVLVVVIVVALSEMTLYQVGQLRRLAREDPLTGALNRKGLREVAPAVHSIATRAQQPVSVAVLDLDAFKAYNDQHGHAAGDELLVELVRFWRTGLRPSDLIGRLGGDEFVLVLPGSSPEQATNTLTRLLRASPALCTIGIAAWADHEDVMDAVDRADRLMYRAKNPSPR